MTTFAHRGALAALAFAWLAANGSTASADALEDFFKGREITIVVPVGAGGTYDHYGRLAAKYMPKYLPGEPKFLMQYMPGAGGTKANNYLYNVAPKDGSVLMSMHSNSLQSQLLRPTGIKYDASEFTAIGQFTDLNSALTVWHKAPATTLDGAKKVEVIMGASGKGSYQYQLPVLMNQVMGTKFKVIAGYKGVRNQNLAMERGEIHGRGGTIVSWYLTNPDWVRDRKIRFLVQVGKTRAPEFPDLPLVTELAKTEEERQMFALLSSGAILGRSLVGPPGIPSDRIAALRAAFDKAMADPELRAEAKKRKFVLKPQKGETLQKLIAEIHATPRPVVEKAKKLIGVKAKKKG